MNTKDYLERLKKIDRLISLKATGTPSELAEKLNISERWVYNYINELRATGAPIKYSKAARSYIYLTSGRFYSCFMDINEVKKEL